MRTIVPVAVLAFLAGCGGGESDPTSPVTGPAAPTTTLNANPTAVTSSGSSTLTWASTNATACAASGGWSGSRPTSGSASTNALTATTTFTLDCSGAGGSASQSVTVTVSGTGPPAPTVILTANPTSVAPGGSATLTWSSTNATSCTASGGWTGAKATSGNQQINGISANTTFSLQCTGSGGSASRSATVAVNGSAPTLSLTANPASVAAGGTSVLTWNSTNATTCAAAGGWSGNKATNGSQNVGPLSQTTVFTLTCTGPGGSSAQSATVAVIGGGNAALSGAVDSSYVARFADNRVYVFSGNVTPDDVDGDAVEPVETVPVTQDTNGCTWSYAAANLAAGLYTIAFTNQAANDLPDRNDALTFVGTRNVTIGSSGTVSIFRPTGILQVGPGRQFTTLRAANQAAGDGAVIEIDASVYDDDVTVWRQNGVTIRGVGGRAHLRGTRVIPFVSGDDLNNGMGLMVTRGTGISVENIEFSGARVTDLNGAGIRVQSRDLTVCNGHFHDNEDGMLGGAAGTLLIEYTEFGNNGFGDPGFDHNVYVDDGSNAGDRLIFRHNYSHHSDIGHTLKTRARENHILYNRLMDEADGRSSYNIDVPNGGLTFIVGNLIQQSPNTDNAAIVNYGSEGLSGGRTHELYVVNNTFVNDRGSGPFLQVAGGTSLVRTINNLFIGGGTPVSGAAAQATTNLATNAPGLVNQNAFDYRLTSTSPARDAGTDPGSAAGTSLLPVYVYVHRAQRSPRPVDARIDIGAYEFQP